MKNVPCETIPVVTLRVFRSGDREPVRLEMDVLTAVFEKDGLNQPAVNEDVLAAGSPRHPSHLSMCRTSSQEMVALGGDLNPKTRRGPGSFNSGFTPLHMASAYGCVDRRLLDEVWVTNWPATMAGVSLDVVEEVVLDIYDVHTVRKGAFQQILRNLTARDVQYQGPVPVIHRVVHVLNSCLVGPVDIENARFPSDHHFPSNDFVAHSSLRDDSSGAEARESMAARVRPSL